MYRRPVHVLPGFRAALVQRAPTVMPPGCLTRGTCTETQLALGGRLAYAERHIWSLCSGDRFVTKPAVRSVYGLRVDRREGGAALRDFPRNKPPAETTGSILGPLEHVSCAV